MGAGNSIFVTPPAHTRESAHPEHQSSALARMLHQEAAVGSKEQELPCLRRDGADDGCNGLQRYGGWTRDHLVQR